MQRGQSIFFIACGILVGWVFSPVWDWFVGRFLDSAAREGVGGTIAEVIAMTVPAHPLLLGIAIGMFVALGVGYWHIFRLLPSFFVFLWDSLPWEHRLYRGTITFEEGQTKTELRFAERLAEGFNRVETEPRSNTTAAIFEDGLVVFRRIDFHAKSIGITVWGRHHPLAIIKHLVSGAEDR